MSKYYFYISLLFQLFLLVTPLCAYSIPVQSDSYYRIHSWYKDDLCKREDINRIIFFIEKFDRGNQSFEKCEETYLYLKEEADPLLKKRQLLKQLYIASHDDQQSLSDLEDALKKDSQGVSIILEKLLAFKAECKA
jgi:hypothetical protein